MMRVAACLKAAFASEREAVRRLHRIKRRRRGGVDNPLGMHPYRCDRCGLWHLGHA